MALCRSPDSGYVTLCLCDKDGLHVRGPLKQILEHRHNGDDNMYMIVCFHVCMHACIGVYVGTYAYWFVC